MSISNLSKAAQLLAKINVQHERIIQHLTAIPAIELDLQLKNVLELYEELNSLKMPDFQSEISHEKVNVQKEEPDLTAAHDEHANIDWNIDNNDSETAVKQEVQPEPVQVESQNKRAEIFIEHISPVELKKESPVSSQRKTINERPTGNLFAESTVASSYSGKTTTLHDKMSSGRKERSVAVHLQSKPLTDLKKSIGVNEKFVFVRELFKGDNHLFNKSIERLNSFPAYEEARRHLFEDLASEMEWNTESKVFADLGELVRRRFNS